MRMCGGARRASSWRGTRPRTRAMDSFRAISRTRKRPRTPGAGAWSTTATWGSRAPRGWFRRGEVVRRDASGMLFFVDRKKHIIRRAGENIAAAEIEAVLQAHDCVAQVAVVAAPDELREEEVLACIVPMPGTTPDAALAETLFEQCNARLAYFKAPGWILFLGKLPTTGTQKVQKTLIFAPGEDPRQRPGIIDPRSRKRRS